MLETNRSGTTRIVAARRLIVRALGERLVLFNPETRICYGMNAEGARVWALLETPRTLEEIRAVLLEEYDVAPDQCEADLRALLRELEAGGLIEVNDEPAPKAS
jgi:hypothetical protein